MQAPQRSTTEQLADELQMVSYHGVGHALGDLSEDAIPNLARIARRLAPDAKDRLRVSIALAVRQAVLLIDPPSRAEAAAALLWLDLDDVDFEEDRSRKRKPLRERHPVVAALLGQRLSSYERHKRWRALYEQVAVNLLTLLDQATALDSAGVPSTVRDVIDETHPQIISLAEAAADLYFAALASLFVAGFHNKCAEHRQLSVRRLYDWVGAADWLLYCYCRFFSAHLRGYRLLPQTQRERLCRLMKLAEASDPFFGYNEHIALLSYAYELERGRKDKGSLVWLNKVKAEVRQAGEKLLESGDVNARDFVLPTLEKLEKKDGRSEAGMLDLCWLSWYQAQFNTSDWPPAVDQVVPDDGLIPDGIAIFAAIGERYLEVITTHADPGRPILAHARRRIHRMIGSFYDIDDWQPLVVGGSLRDHVDHFFDKASQPSACQNRRNMLKCGNDNES